MSQIMFSLFVFVFTFIIVSIRNKFAEGLFEKAGKEEKTFDRSMAYSISLALGIYATIFNIVENPIYNKEYFLALSLLLVIVGIILGLVVYTGIMLCSCLGDKDWIYTITKKNHIKYLVCNIAAFEFVFWLLIFLARV